MKQRPSAHAKLFMDKLGVAIILTSVHHRQVNGQAKRAKWKNLQPNNPGFYHMR